VIELASMLKLLLYISLIVCVFAPWAWRSLTLASAIACSGRRLHRQTGVAGLMLATFETSIAKMRVFRCRISSARR